MCLDTFCISAIIPIFIVIIDEKIMILGASILQLPAIKKAKEMGLDVIAVDMDPDAVGF